MTLQIIQPQANQTDKEYLQELARTTQWNFEKLSQKMTDSGSYTPTLTNTTNISASTAYEMPWSRVGNVVTVGFKAGIDPTAASPTNTELTFTLPITCRTTPVLAGCASGDSDVQTGAIEAVSGSTAKLRYEAVQLNNRVMYGTFQYIVN